MQGNSSENVTENHTFKIHGKHYNEKCFPSLNDMLHEAERHPQAYNKMKRMYGFIAINSIRMDLRGWKANGVVIPHYVFGEPNKGKKEITTIS